VSLAPTWARLQQPTDQATRHTPDDIEPHFLDALRDGAPRRMREVDTSIETSGWLSSADDCRSLDALVELHDLPFELHYRNRIRSARRQLRRASQDGKE
jgi:hypothetical protein